MTSCNGTTCNKSVELNNLVASSQQAGNKQCEHIVLTSGWKSITTSLLQVCYNWCVFTCIPFIEQLNIGDFRVMCNLSLSHTFSWNNKNHLRIVDFFQYLYICCILTCACSYLYNEQLTKVVQRNNWSAKSEFTWKCVINGKSSTHCSKNKPLGKRNNRVFRNELLRHIQKTKSVSKKCFSSHIVNRIQTLINNS